MKKWVGGWGLGLPVALGAFPVFGVFVGIGVFFEDIDSHLPNPGLARAGLNCFLKFGLFIKRNFAKIMATAIGAVFINNNSHAFVANRALFS